MKDLEKKMTGNKNKIISESDLLLLKELVDEDPNIYLDELTLLFGIKTGKYNRQSTVWKYVVEDLGYSSKVLTRVARESCETDETQFLQALSILLQEHPERLITIDKTHKDRNASRKQRGWSKRNCKAVITRKWFQNVARYTLIAVANINGFIPAACHTVLRDQISDKGAAGTVDADYFIYWVRT